MTTEFVLDADTGYTPNTLDSITVRIDGEEYTAYPPKDSLPILMARLNDTDELERDPNAQQELVLQILLSIFEEETAEFLLERLMDMRDRKFTLGYVLHIVGLVGDHYRPLMDEHYADMGVSNPLGQEGNREQRRTASRTPAKKTAKKAALRGGAAPAK